MRRTAFAFVAGAVAMILLAGCTASDDPPETNDAPPSDMPEDVFTPVLVSTLETPRAVLATDGRVHVAYELFVNNVTTQTATVESIDVLDGDGESLLRLDEDEVEASTHSTGTGLPGRILEPGQSALMWLDVVVDSMDEVPTSLSHSIGFGFDPGAPPVITTEMTERVATTEVDLSAPVEIGPPLEGDNWMNGNGCCGVSAHRSAVNPINGTYHVPERYAIDYVRLDADGAFISGPVDELESYAYFGANIIAVGDGPIISMRDDLPEQEPGADPTGLALDEYGGNHIVQDLGDGVYAFYAHLQPGNPQGLEVGQDLKKGETIALLGNTGNTDSPHLHFHLMDSPSPLASNGLPFVYDSFELVGAVTADDLATNLPHGGPFAIDATDSGTRTGQYPLELTVMDYPED
ncbi:MAG: M23 family metallopeptidase [Actinomycetota bacterium]